MFADKLQTRGRKMANSRKKKSPSLYQSHGFWYFKITVENPKFLLDPSQPKKIRKSISTETSNKAEAEKFQKKYLDGFARQNSKCVDNLESLIAQFIVPEKNPMYLSAPIEGRSYTLKHSQNVARSCRQLLEKLDEKMAYILHSKISTITRLDCIEVREMIFKEYGKTHVAKEAFCKFKMLMTYAANIGLIPFSPADKIADIKPEDPKPIYVLSPADIALLYSAEELFTSEDFRAMFITFATTGLRRSELAALTVGQIYKFPRVKKCGKNTTFSESWAICVDRAFKDDAWKIVDKPKWNKVRCIPICDITYKALEPYLKDKGPEERVFPMIKHHRLYDDFAFLKENCYRKNLDMLLETPEGLEKLSPHKLRHALNTALSVRSDVKDSLSNEYMSWEKQKTNNVKKMQSHYTHINVNHLCIVSDIIQEMYSNDDNDNLIMFESNA